MKNLKITTFCTVFFFTILLIQSCNKNESKEKNNSKVSSANLQDRRLDTDIKGEFYENYPYKDLTLVDSNNNTFFLRIYGKTTSKIDDYISNSHLKIEAYTLGMGRT